MIPYGYKYENEKYAADDKEAETLLGIFNSYISGESLKQIADRLNQTNTVFYLGKCGWNKARIKRILENRNYIGDNGYPQIVPAELFGQAQPIINSKSPGYNLDPVTTAMKQKAYCEKCGSKMLFNNKCKGYPKWECSNPDCAETEKLKHRYILKSLINIMNGVIENPKLLHKDDNCGILPDSESTQKLNDINRMMNQKDIDFKNIQAEILAYTDMLYQKCDSGINQNLTEALMQIYKEHKAMDKLDTALFEGTVSSFYIAKDGAVTVSFINGANITERSKTDA